MKTVRLVSLILNDLELKEKYELIIKAILKDLDLNKSALLGIESGKFCDDISRETAYLILESEILEN